MNTQGRIRRYIARKSSLEKFVNHVCRCLSQEFELSYDITYSGEDCIIKFEKYQIKIPKPDMAWFQGKSPYALDMVLLERLKEQGLEFSEKRSQYIRHCYEMYTS